MSLFEEGVSESAKRVGLNIVWEAVVIGGGSNPFQPLVLVECQWLWVKTNGTILGVGELIHTHLSLF